MTAPTMTHPPAAPGWYARPGDPVGVVRRWTGDCWAYQIQGGDAQEAMERLRLIPAEHRSAADNDQLERAAREVSRVEELVMGSERQTPPLVAMPQPYPNPYSQQPYAPQPLARLSAKTSRPGRGLVLSRVLVGVAAALILLAIRAFLPTQSDPTNLKVGDCLTMSAPAVSTSSDSTTWRAGSCDTAKDGPVSYLVVAVVPKSTGCASLYTYVYKGSTTFCLVENLAVGSCARWDAKNFMFDVACTDARAEIKVAQRVEKGSGVACGNGQEALEFPLPGRTYCLTKP